jgi:tetratricopeptide (TPR) repeat protein
MNLGIVYARLNDTSLAEHAYMRALHLRADGCADCYYNLGNLYLSTGAHRAALDAYANATARRPMHARAWLNALLLLDELHMHAECATRGRRALEHLAITSDDAARVRATLATCLAKIGEYESAERLLLEVVDGARTTGANNQLAIHLGNLAVLYHRWKRVHIAEQYYQQALQLQPDMRVMRQNFETLKAQR